MPYQHHYQASYSSHYPQAAYGTPHYQYAAHPSPQPPHTPAPITAASRPTQQSQSQSQGSSGGVDTSDLATLNDALGAAGVDLRVAPLSYPFFPIFSDRYTSRPRKNPYSALRTRTSTTAHSKTARASNHPNPISTPASSGPQCAP